MKSDLQKIIFWISWFKCLQYIWTQKIWSILWTFVIATAQNIKICCLISSKYGFKSYRDVWIILQFADIQFSPCQSKFCKIILQICFIKFLLYLNTSSNVWCKINLLFIIWRIHDELNLSGVIKKNFSVQFNLLFFRLTNTYNQLQTSGLLEAIYLEISSVNGFNTPNNQHKYNDY